MMKKYALMLFFILPFLWMSFASPAPAFGATITVDTLADNTTPDGDCSLREAIQNANDNAATFVDCTAGAGASDTIDFGGGAASGTITFTSAISVITTVIIDGGDDIILDGGGAQQIFTLGGSGSDLTLTNITIQNGFSSGAGGAILANSTDSVLSIVNSMVRDNDADGTGGAILSNGSLTITNSVFQGNRAGVDGGAIDHSSSDPLTVTTSAFINNTAGTVVNTGGSGGAIYHSGAVLGPSAVTGSYFLNNQVDNAESFDGGGAIYHGAGIMSITSSVFLANNVDGDDAHGGAVFNNSSDDFAMTINYSHFGEFLGVLIPPIPPITIPGPDFDVVAAIGVGSANTVTGTTVNTSGGGAIFNNGYILITGTSFIANSSSNHGGAFMNIASVGDPFPQPLGQQVIIANSTFTLNTATIQGGAIQHGLPGNVDDLLVLANVTIANNTAALGDGIFTEDGESTGLSNFDDVYVVNSIIANDNCAGVGVGGGVLGNGNMDPGGNNVFFNSTCDIRQQDAGNSPATPITTDPMLSSPELAFNLGNIFTVVLSIGNGSSASGTGDPVICAAAPVLNIDQRNLPLGLRPQGAPNCDIGAYESAEPAPAPEIDVQGNSVSIPGDGSNIPNVSNHTEYVTTTVGMAVSRTFTIQNTGNANLSITLPLTVPAGFTITTPPSASIAGSANSTFTVECTAASSGLFAGTISITNNDSDENPYVFNISCFVNPLPPDINVRDNGDTLDILDGDLAPDVADGTNFGTTIMGFPISNSFIIQNVGGSDLNVTPAITVPAGFTLTSSPTSNIPAGNITTFTVECDADAGGVYNGSVLIASDDPDENPYEFAISCIVDAPEINVRGNAIDIPDGDVTPTGADFTDFGSTTVGSPLSSTFVIQNNGTFSLTLNTTVTVPAGFSVTATPTSPVAIGNDTFFTVQCDALVAGPYTGIVSITNNDSDENPYTFTITCDVTATPEPEIEVFGNATLIANNDVTPALADDTDFGATTTGTAISRTYTIENIGTANLTFGAVTAPAGFTVTLQPTSPVTPGNDATFTVQCDAVAPATYSGNVTFTNNDSDENPFTFAITCLVNPTAPEINVQGNSVTIVDGDITPDLADHTEFVATTVGSPVQRTYTIQNTGTADLNIIVTVPLSFTPVAPFPSLLIPAGNSTTLIIECDAAGVATFTGTVSIANDDSDENPYTFAIVCDVTAPTPEINVQGNGIDIPDGDVSPILADDTDFGSTSMGTPVTNTFTIQNLGSDDLNLGFVAVSDPINFSVTAQPAGTIGIGLSSTFNIQCTAVANGTFTTTVSVPNTDTDENPYNFDVTCVVNALPPEMDVQGNAVSIVDGDITPSFADHTQFDATIIGTPVSRTFTILNTGAGNLTVNPVVTVPVGFTLMTPPTSPVAPAGNTTFTVQCDAGSAAPFTGTVSIINDDSDENPYNFEISCVVTATPLPEIDVLGNGVSIANGDFAPALADDTDFGATILGTPITRTYTIQNLGTAPLTITSTTVSGVTDFTVITPPAPSVPVGGNTTFTVQCNAVTLGPVMEIVNVFSDDSDENPYEFSITCNMTTPAPQEINVVGNAVNIGDGDITPDLADDTDFGSTPVGAPISRTYTIENLGGTNLSVTPAITVPAGFTLMTPPTSPVAPAGNTTFTVQCNAGSVAPFSGTVSILNDDSDENPYTFDITCNVTAVAPEINVQGNAVNIVDGDITPALADDTDFGSTPVGTPLTNTFTIQNLGSQALTITGAVTVSDPVNFSVTLQPAASIGIGLDSTFDVQCTAVANGTFTATVSIPNDDSDENPYTFDITCNVTSVDPEINVLGNAVSIVDGDTTPDVADDTDFGTTAVGVNVSRTFTIENLGVNNLTVSIDPVSAPFSLMLAPTSPVAGSGNTTFTIECDASIVGSFSTTISITNNDIDENPYTFDVACNVTNNAPEMNVVGNAVSIVDGDNTPSVLDFTDFGTTNVGIPIARTFTIENLGVLNLTLTTPITVPAGFTVTTQPTSPVTPAGNTTFTIECDATVANTYGGTVSIVNNDANENPYEFDIACVVNLAATSADLSLSKTVSDSTPQVGDTITYTVTVSNFGPDATTNVQVVDTLPPTVTYVPASFAVTQGTFVEGTMTWTVGTLGNPSSATLTFDVVVNANPGITTNYAQVTASDITDPNSTPNNGPQTPDEDDDAEVSFLFDPPFGRKSFVEAGVNVLEWTVVWANPSNNPVVVSMSDPLLGGTTFVPGSLTCTTFGTSSQSLCQHNSGTNQIEFTGVIDPNPGVTLATLDSASNRLVIVYRVVVPDGVTTVSNVATLTTPDGDVTVTETYTRVITPPVTGGGGTTTTTTTGSVLDTVKALPATGETPWWADITRVLLFALIPITLIGIGGYWTMKRRRSNG
jgi:uncharacterized repeat protein (TIGR01451 family)/CSLREA domain-containing protein